MITAVDANIVLDLLVGTAAEIELAELGLRRSKASGSICMSAISYAEVAGRFPNKNYADEFFRLIDCRIESLDEFTAFVAGQMARDYRLRGGSRSRILPDFLIAAHAQVHAQRLLTRDKRFFKDTFPQLNAVDPADLR